LFDHNFVLVKEGHSLFEKHINHNILPGDFLFAPAENVDQAFFPRNKIISMIEANEIKEEITKRIIKILQN